MGTLARNELSNIESSFCIIYRTKKNTPDLLVHVVKIKL